jgi:ketosteroid isomerase-like protein
MAVLTFAAAGSLAAGEADEKPVAQATAQFYAALNALFTGDAGPMESVWSHADDVTYMGPAGGMQVGWKDVSANWREQAALRLGGHVTAEKLQIQAGADVAVSCCYETGENIVAGKTQNVAIRATNTFRKEHGQWKMIGHHTDLLPYLNK